MAEDNPPTGEDPLGGGGDAGGAGGAAGGEGMGGEDPGGDIPVPKPLPLSSKGDSVVWGAIAAMAVFAYVLYIFWRKKGRVLWAKLTGSVEEDLSLYEINHSSRDGKTYHLHVAVEDNVFVFKIDPPVIDDFEQKYAEAEEAGHLDEDEDGDDKKKKDAGDEAEALRVREELWTMLKNRAAVTFQLAQVVDEDAPHIDTAFKTNCITDAKYRSFSATRDFIHAQFKEIPDIAEVLKPGSQGGFLRSVVLEVQHRVQMAQRRAELAQLQTVLMQWMSKKHRTGELDEAYAAAPSAGAGAACE